MSRGRRRADRLFEGFQGRPVRKTITRSIENRLPDELYRYGTALRIWYESDKRDPGDPKGRGAQGHWKLFVHEHGSGVGIYTKDGSPDVEEQVYEPDWPEVVFYLGKLSKFEYEDDDGVWEEGGGGRDLWCWDNGRVLMALPRNFSRLGRIILWKGGRLKVTWRGIHQ